MFFTPAKKRELLQPTAGLLQLVSLIGAPVGSFQVPKAVVSGLMNIVE